MMQPVGPFPPGWNSDAKDSSDGDGHRGRDYLGDNATRESGVGGQGEGSPRILHIDTICQKMTVCCENCMAEILPKAGMGLMT